MLRSRGAERPFTGRYVHEKRGGVCRWAGCGAELFASETKFDSGTGWRSFTEPADRATADLKDDHRLGVDRIEVNCSAGSGHLGHVFPDGPDETGTATAPTPARSSSMSSKPSAVCGDRGCCRQAGGPSCQGWRGNVGDRAAGGQPLSLLPKPRPRTWPRWPRRQCGSSRQMREFAGFSSVVIVVLPRSASRGMKSGA